VLSSNNSDGGPIRQRIARLQYVSSRVEDMNRRALLYTAERIIRGRISTPDEKTRETSAVTHGVAKVIFGLDYGDSEANLGPREKIQERLEKLYTDTLGSIEIMAPGQLFDLIHRLRMKTPLVDILKQLPKRRSLYRLKSSYSEVKSPAKHSDYHEVSPNNETQSSNATDTLKMT